MPVLDQLLQELQARYKHDTPAGTPSTPYMHGPGGLWTTPGVERDIFSTRVQPRGMAGVLPAMGTVVTHPLFEYLTGFLAGNEVKPSGPCDDPGTPGPMKNCTQTAAFGLYQMMTRELDITRVGRQVNRSELFDLRIVNDPLLNNLGGMIQPDVPANPALAREVLVRFMELGVAMQNKMAAQMYIGNPANNVGSGYAEFPGLDLLISTGKIDAITGTTCPSLDSLIRDFNYRNVDDISAAASGGMVNLLTYMFRYLRDMADRMGMSPVNWTLAMRPLLFYELTAIWPCSYLTYRCGTQPITNGSTVMNIVPSDNISMRDAMRQGNYLLIDGQQVPVILDDAIVEEAAKDNKAIKQGCFASDIYILPLTVAGGIASLYWEYLDYQATAMSAAGDGNVSDYFWTDGGRWLWHKKPPKNWCVQWNTRIEPRLILKTPHLAARLQNVQYCPLIHEREPFNADPYFVDGGVTSRPGPSFYADWKSGGLR